MEAFEMPYVEIVYLDEQDVIVTSGEGEDIDVDD